MIISEQCSSASVGEPIHAVDLRKLHDASRRLATDQRCVDLPHVGQYAGINGNSRGGYAITLPLPKGAFKPVAKPR